MLNKIAVKKDTKSKEQIAEEIARDQLALLELLKKSYKTTSK